MTNRARDNRSMMGEENEESRLQSHLCIALILTLSFVLNIVGITWGLPNYVDWAVDSVAPFNVLEAAYYRFSRGWYTGYPPVHLAILAALNAPLMGYLMLSGGLKAPSQVFPFGFADPLSTLTSVILISRVASALMGVGIVLLVYLVVRELFDRQSALFSALIVALYYPLVFYASNANVDVPYLFWGMLAIYYFVRVLKHGSLKEYVLFALFGTLSVCTKDQAYGLFLFSPLPILWARLTELSQVSPRRPRLMGVIFDRRHVLATAVAVVTFVLAQNLIFNLSGFIEHVRLITSPDLLRNIPRYAPTLSGRLQLLQETLSLLASGLTVPLFGICLAGSIYCAFKFPRYSLPLLFLAASYYLLFINVVRFVTPRYVLPIGIILAFFGGKLLAEMWHKTPRKALTRAAIGVALVYAALFPIQLNLLFLRDSRYTAEQWMQEHFKRGAIVETFAPHVLHKYYPRFPSWVKVRSSKLAAGTQWKPLATDHVRVPNLHTGREPPDYIVLSERWYGRFQMSERAGTGEARVLKDLFQGVTGYTLVASFKTATILQIRGLPINPRILIFARTGADSFEGLAGPRGDRIFQR